MKDKDEGTTILDRDRQPEKQPIPKDMREVGRVAVFK